MAYRKIVFFMAEDDALPGASDATRRFRLTVREKTVNGQAQVGTFFTERQLQDAPEEYMARHVAKALRQLAELTNPTANPEHESDKAL